ncbi:OmpA family protein [Bradyrhizobium sp. 21]|uniref:OmpA family protein n=1 Tax=Bradyrhizobium sp. 21 TaxID=2782666 RepID=UPI001FF96019|nr:OmpA family protein [Bradyrhizobium sp. 21]MCK1389039.1 OmpA family protein [Bradyrhizobium sp. 21]
MRKRISVAGVIFAILGHLLPASAASAQACQDYFDRAKGAVSGNSADLKALRELTGQVRNSQECTELDKTCFSYLVADTVAALVSSADGGKPVAKLVELAREAFMTAPTWRAAWAWAHEFEKEKNYDEASLLYQRAYAAIADVKARISFRHRGSFVCAGEGEQLPPSSDEDELARLAVQTNALATKFVEPPPTRCGAAGPEDVLRVGCGAEARIPLPVDFETGSAKLTDKGRTAVAFLVRYLRAQGAEAGPFVLTGHSDQRGSARRNCQLSKRRLDAVVAQLRQSGIGSDFNIEPIAMGSRDPFSVVGEKGYRQDQIDRINRRVELRSSAPAGGRCAQ